MTLSTSAIHKAAKTALIYLLVSIFCALFGGVYEHFGHGVYSYHMIYAFAYPLVGGSLPALTYCMKPSIPIPGFAARTAWHCGIATATVGSIIQGVLWIYGTTNRLTTLYPIVAASLLGLAVLIYLVQALCRKRTAPPYDLQ